MSENNGFIEKRKKFIEQFDRLNPSTGAEHIIKDLAEQYKLSLDDLAAHQDKLTHLFSLNKVDEEKLEKQKKYPTGVRNLHLGTAAIIATAIFTGLFLGASTYLGGSSIETWSTPLQLITASIGSIFAIPAGIANFVSNKKHFSPERTMKKKISLEKLIYKRSREIAAARNLAAIDVEQKIDDILNGKNIFKEEVIIKKGDKTKVVSRFKEGFKALPLLTKWRLNHLLNKIQKDGTLLNKIYGKLYIHTEKVKSDELGRPTTFRKTEEKRQSVPTSTNPSKNRPNQNQGKPAKQQIPKRQSTNTGKRKNENSQGRPDTVRKTGEKIQPVPTSTNPSKNRPNQNQGKPTNGKRYNGNRGSRG